MAVLRLEITNWEKYNKGSSKSEHPWWFKFHNRIFEDPVIKKLSNDELIVWIQCLCLASIQRSKVIEFDTEYLTFARHLPGICQVSAIQKLSRHGQLTRFRDRHHTPREEKSREEKNPLNPPGGMDAAAGSKNLLLLTAWNVNRGSLPEAKALSTRRMRLADARLREEPDLAAWESVVKRIAASRFCTGHNDRNWVATFDWLLAPDTRLKVLEGKYDNRKAPSTIAPPPPGKQIAMDTKLK